MLLNISRPIVSHIYNIIVSSGYYAIEFIFVPPSQEVERLLSSSHEIVLFAKSTPMVGFMLSEKMFLTYLLMMQVFPTPELPSIITFKTIYFCYIISLIK